MCYSINDVREEIVELRNCFRNDNPELVDIFIWRLEQMLNGLFDHPQRRNDMILAAIREIEILVRSAPDTKNKNNLMDVIREKRREINLKENLKRKKVLFVLQKILYIY